MIYEKICDLVAKQFVVEPETQMCIRDRLCA